MYDHQPSTIATSYEYIVKNSSPKITKGTQYISHETSVISKTPKSKLFLQHMNDGYIWEEELSIDSLVEYGKSVKSIENDLKLFVKAFENQRKIYKYSIAWNKYQNDIISDDEMDTLEEILAVHIDNCSLDETNTRMMSLFQYIEEDNFDLEELSSILGVPRKYILQLSSQTTLK